MYVVPSDTINAQGWSCFPKARGSVRRPWRVYLRSLTRALIAQSQNYAKRVDRPIFNNVLLPRTKGFLACITAFRDSHIKFVYGCFHHLSALTWRPHNCVPSDEIPSPNYAPNLLSFNYLSALRFPRACSSIRHPRCDPLSSLHILMLQLPKENGDLASWLLDRWGEKEKILEKLRGDWEISVKELQGI